MDVLMDIMKSPRIDEMNVYELPPGIRPQPESFKTIANAITNRGGTAVGIPIPMPMSARTNSNRTSSVILISPRNIDLDFLQRPPSLTVSERLAFL